MKKTLPFLFLAFTALFACKDKDPKCTPLPDNVEYLIFGHHSCFCYTCCNAGFKLSGMNLYKGTRTDVADEYAFENAPLTMAQYESAKKLVDELPNELLDENGKSYGCGGCADQPVYYIEFKKNGTVYKWWIDSQTDGFPDYVKTYSATIGTVLNGLQ